MAKLELKPCPFCGGEVEIVYRGGGWFWVHKNEPLFYPMCPITHSRKYNSYKETVEAWNRRTYEGKAD